MATVLTHPSGLRTLVTLSRSVRETVIDEGQLPGMLARLAANEFGDTAMVWRRPDTGGAPVCAAVAVPGAAAEDDLRAVLAWVGPPGDGLVAQAFAEGLAAALGPEDMPAYADKVHPALTARLRHSGVGAVAVLPMRTATERVVGALVVLRSAARPEYTQDELRFLQSMVDIATITLDSAQMLRDSAAAAEELRRQVEWVDQVSDAIITCDPENRVMAWNVGAENIYQYSSAEAMGCDAEALLDTRYLSRAGEPVDSTEVFATLATTGRWSGELRQRRADGVEVELLCSLTRLVDEERRPIGWVAANRDVTDERHQERLALYDTLTGLPNRRFLIGHLSDALERTASAGTRAAVLFIDLDGFKQVNDVLGHDAGDEVLRVTGERLGAAVRGRDVVARLGGDEFVVVVEGVTRDVVRRLADRLIEVVGQPIPWDGQLARVLPSIGVAMTDPATAIVDAQELVRAADGAMYIAKRGRHGLIFASDSDGMPEPAGGIVGVADVVAQDDEGTGEELVEELVETEHVLHDGLAAA